jgi:hypothetical protein
VEFVSKIVGTSADVEGFASYRAIRRRILFGAISGR